MPHPVCSPTSYTERGTSTGGHINTLFIFNREASPVSSEKTRHRRIGRRTFLAICGGGAVAGVAGARVLSRPTPDLPPGLKGDSRLLIIFCPCDLRRVFAPALRSAHGKRTNGTAQGFLDLAEKRIAPQRTASMGVMADAVHGTRVPGDIHKGLAPPFGGHVLALLREVKEGRSRSLAAMRRSARPWVGPWQPDDSSAYRIQLDVGLKGDSRLLIIFCPCDLRRVFAPAPRSAHGKRTNATAPAFLDLA